MYVCVGGTSSFYGYQINLTSGQLTAVPGPMPSQGFGCIQVGVLPFSAGNQLLLNYSGPSDLQAYVIDANAGALTSAVGSTPLSPTSLSFIIDPLNQYFYSVYNATQASMSSFPVSSGGTVSGGMGPYTFSGAGTQYDNASYTITPNGKYIYGFDAPEAKLSGFTSTNGVLGGVSLTFPATCASTSQYTSGLFSDPLSRFIYIICNNGSTTSIVPYQIPVSGILNPQTTITSASYSQNANLAFDATGNYVYLQGGTTTGIVGLQIAGSGNLTALLGTNTSPIAFPGSANGNGAAGFGPVIDSTNSFLAASAGAQMAYIFLKSAQGEV